MFLQRLAELCRPDMTVRSVLQVDLDALRARGVGALLLDLDNTLVLWRSREVRPEVAAWVRRAVDAGFRVCIVSNAGRAGRVAPVARELGIPFFVRASKPRRRAFRLAAAQLHVPAERTAVIGDQIFTDVVGGNRAGMTTVLVSPLDYQREFVWTKLMRRLEAVVQRRLEPRAGGGRTRKAHRRRKGNAHEG